MLGGGGGGSVAFEGYICVWGTLRTGLYLSVDIVLLVWTCCSQNRKVADHAH